MTDAVVLLVLEASTRDGSVALVRRDAVAAQVLARCDVPMGATRDDGLLPAVQTLLADGGLTPRGVAGVVCGAGPGSFTSLRIAGSLAKGFAHGAGVPLHAVSSLLLAAGAYAQRGGGDGVYVVHADALRGDRYAQRVRVQQGQATSEGACALVAAADLDAFAGSARRLSVGTASDPAREHAVVSPHAGALPAVASSAWSTAVSLDAWEPAYGRLAEAQVVWERTHGHALPTV